MAINVQMNLLGDDGNYQVLYPNNISIYTSRSINMLTGTEITYTQYGINDTSSNVMPFSFDYGEITVWNYTNFLKMSLFLDFDNNPFSFKLTQYILTLSFSKWNWNNKIKQGDLGIFESVTYRESFNGIIQDANGSISLWTSPNVSISIHTKDTITTATNSSYGLSAEWIIGISS